MRRFKHLTWDDRVQIAAFLIAKKTPRYIAEQVGCSAATIYNEMKRGRYDHRNSDWTTENRYSPEIAEKRYRANLAAKGAPLKIGSDIRLANYIEDKIANEKYSPAAVLGEIETKGLEFDTMICVGTIYNYIDSGVFLRLEKRHLPMRGKRKRSYKQVQTVKRAHRGKSIEKRTWEINKRGTFGHWEMDCVEGKKGSSRTGLMLTERRSRHNFVMPMDAQTSANVVAELDRLERKYGELFYQMFKTITVDNGSEFADCDGMQRSCVHPGKKRLTVYYCHPYSYWERGSNERNNGIFRRQVPKGTDLNDVSDEEMARIERWMNTYPRPMFGYRCAQDIFDDEMALLINARK